jgi:hypothetical protein
MRISRAATARTQITNTSLGAASVAVALRATYAGLANVLLPAVTRLQGTGSELRMPQAS